MKKRNLTIIALILALVMILPMLSSCAKKSADGNNADVTPDGGKEEPTGNTVTPPTGGAETGTDNSVKLNYTYKVGTTSLGATWNPHLADADKAILGYVSSPLVDVSILDSEKGIYQWVYEMAQSVADVTAQNKSDITKYGAIVTGDIDSGYVFEIKLNPNAAWENGVKITADDYIYSMMQLLEPKMRNSGAEAYIDGEFAIAGAMEYYNAGAPIYLPVVPNYSNGGVPDYSFDVDASKVYINLTSNEMTITGYSFEYMLRYSVDKELYDKLADYADGYGYILVSEDNADDVYTICDQYLKTFGMSIYNSDGSINDEYFKEFLFYASGKSEALGFDSVGLYKVDDHTIRYVCENRISLEEFLPSLTSNWLVYRELYEAGKSESNGFFVTNYGTSKDTSMSYGPYKIESIQSGEKIELAQNENWYGFQKNSDGTLKKDEEGNLISYTGFLVDGESVRQYMTTRIIIEAMNENEMKNAFLKGELSEWYPASDEFTWMKYSGQLVQIDEQYVTSLFFNTNASVLQNLDEQGINTNSFVLSNDNFRKALSLAINRDKYAEVTAGYKPTVSLITSVYNYDLYRDPASFYRRSDAAKQAILDLYGVKYGEGEKYATLDEAYASITGYDASRAKMLFMDAFDELTEEGLYVAGADIKIQIAWSGGELTYDDERQIEILNSMISEALSGTGFGRITLEPIGSVENRYAEVMAGRCAIGFGAWGVDADKPFELMKLYFDFYDNGHTSEVLVWSPYRTDLTINVNGNDVTMSWSDWARACTTGAYANADIATKLKITAALEREFLSLYLNIPLCSTACAYLMSYQVSNYTDNYNVAYGFGGLRLLRYNFDDAA